jgi:ABC-2 type transport system ATP-binding protein
MNGATALLEIGGVAKSYGALKALENIDLTLGAGELVVLLGPNGAGKTTLFQILCGLRSPDTGHARISGLANTAAAARAGMGLVFQQPTLDLDLTVRANLRFHGHLYGMGGRTLDARIAAELDRSGVSDVASRPCRELSGGNRRKVELARALLHEPSLLLMDEATAGLDHASRRALLEEVLDLRKRRGVGILWATHLVDEAEAADRILILHKGRIIRDAAPSVLLRETGEVSLGPAFLSLTDPLQQQHATGVHI